MRYACLEVSELVPRVAQATIDVQIRTEARLRLDLVLGVAHVVVHESKGGRGLFDLREVSRITDDLDARLTERGGVGGAVRRGYDPVAGPR
jgi:hypothetical protein